MDMGTVVIGTDEFDAWFQGLDAQDTRAVTRTVDQLEIMGVSLGYPLSSAIKGSKIALRELRIRAGKQIRVFYVFDVERQAVLLIGGDKVGDDRFYEVMISRSEKILADYLSSLKKG
jgi:hypothetical protein